MKYRCRHIQNDSFWGAIRPRCTYGLISTGILNEVKECGNCPRYRAGSEEYKVPYNALTDIGKHEE